ncbi:TolC family protein [Alteromonas sp. 5E99-2]|uniref:TolC family protein n=1 Tax=Alteromonas sp. 5E99-2 TaxID=2817683 RepID=UPI001A98C8DD|nr:TolC family protein [Alteromonas sp. 5E99-2]MBO1256299.1 TolC family protein [Alteromonas sp. 5E99-2]
MIHYKSNKGSAKPLVIALSIVSLMQGCAIPTIQTKEVNQTLPEQYGASTSIGEVNINWEQWFDDPTLKELINIALTNNQEVATLLQRINIAANEVYAREGEYLPQLNAGIEVDTEKVGEFTRKGAVEEQLNIREDRAFPDPLANLALGLNASWELDVWNKLRNASKAASLDYFASIEYQKFFVTQLVAEVSEHYFELLAFDNKLRNIDKTLDIQRNVITTLNQLKTYGRTTSLPLIRFQAEVKRNESEKLLIQQHIIETENKLNLLLGRTPQHIERTPSQLMVPSLQIPAAGVPSDLLVNRPDIRQAELELKAAKLNIDVAKANFYPSFTLNAGVGLEAFDTRYLLDIPESLAYSLGGDIFLPLINRRAIKAEYKNASAEQIQAAYDYEYTVIRAVSEVSTSLSKLDKLTQNYELKRQQITALEQSIEVANRLFSSAHGEYLEVLLAQRETLEAQGELVEMRTQQFSALVELYRSLGGGWKV